MNQHLNAIEKGMLFLAAVFVVVGLYTAVYPSEMRVPHPGSGRYQSLIGQDPPAERVSREKARVYGVISLAFGVGLGWLALHHPRKSS